MANTSLPNLTERTATANSDLIHVNSGGTDYKETKANFLSDVNSSISALNNSLTNSLKLGDWTANLTLPYTPTSDGFISVWLNPSSASGAYARLSVTGDSHAMGLNAKGGDGVTLVFPIKKNATVSQAALSNGTLSVRFISIFG